MTPLQSLPSFQQDLNEAQLEAVTYCEGPSLVIAGAGSGKTRVLTYKIAYLLQQGYEPWSILALTFTNKAAREMNERIGRICGNINMAGIWSGTFHSIFARILRIEHEAIGMPADYTIYDTADSRSLIKTIVRELGLDEKVYKPNTVGGRISEAKNHLLLPSQYAADSSIMRRDHIDNLGEVHRIYTLYNQRLRASGAMDFDDLLLYTYLLLRDHEDIRNRYKARFQYILVDEYQDTNLAQHSILSLLTEADSRICVVGDDAQSIYGFRGADITNILNFQKQYPRARLIKLECNYRSTRNIVDAANSVIRYNRGQIPKKVYAAGDEGDRIQVIEATTDKEEAQLIVQEITKLHTHDMPYNEIALLYRTNAQSRAFEECFQQAGIPYRIYGGLSFYQRKEIKDTLAYLRLLTNPHDEEAFRRIINYPARGIGATTLQKVYVASASAGTSPWNIIAHPDEYPLPINKGAQAKLTNFCKLIIELQEMQRTHTASEVAKKVIVSSGMARDFLADLSVEGTARKENVDELIGSIMAYEKERLEEEGKHRIALSDFLATVSLLTDADQKEDNQPRVTLMTVHAAKGLEFGTVFITGVEDDLFPNANAKLYPKEMEEERRLFYVALTRAKTYCYLTYANTRFRFGNLQFCEPSTFISEIDAVFLEKRATRKSSPRSFRSSSNNFREHNNWGGNTRSNRFDDFFGSPSEDDFRQSFSGSSSSYNDRSYDDANGSNYYRRYEPQTPRHVMPPAPPEGFKRAGISQKKETSTSHSPATGIPVGTKIEHERFGRGTIIATEGEGASAKISVAFDKAGTKNLLVKFAKFRILPS